MKSVFQRENRMIDGAFAVRTPAASSLRFAAPPPPAAGEAARPASRFLRCLSACAASLLLSAGVLAQDLGVKAPAQSRPIMIGNATVHTVSGDTFEKGYVLFENGKITAVGAEPAPQAAPGSNLLFIDGSGKHVYPGLVSSNTLMGLVEIESVRATRDYSESSAPVAPEVRAAVAVNPDSTLIPVTRSNGILTAAVLPLGGVVPGRAAVIRMDGWTWEDLAVLDDAGLMINWPSLRTSRGWWNTRSEDEQREEARRSLQTIDQLFDDAAAYVAARAADPALPTDMRYEAMRGVMERGLPCFIRAEEVEQIRSAVAWAAERKLKAVIVGGRDVPQCADMLVRHNVPVLVTGTFKQPKRRDSNYDDAYTLPARLEAAGVKWCLGATGGSFDTPHERNLPYHAGLAVAHGLPRDAAIRAITLSAAEVLGVGQQLGSLDAGKSATLIITDGDPLEITTKVERAFIDGREIDLSNKHEVLYQKYMEKYRQLGLIAVPGNP